jgi:hypothetical protein
MLGMSIFVTALLLAFGVFPNSQKATAHSRNYNIATAMAREFLEQELAKDYDSIVTTPADPDTWIAQPRFIRSNTKEAAAQIAIPFDVRIDVAPVVAVPPVIGKVVTATVRWEDGPFLREVSYESWVAQ